MEYSWSISKEDLENSASDSFDDKIGYNGLKYTLRKLGEYYVKNLPHFNPSELKSMDDNIQGEHKNIAAELHSVISVITSNENISLPRYPAGMPVTPQKRVRSDNSMGDSSTYTTPKRLITAEPNVQEMQSFLMREIIEVLYKKGGIPVDWPRGRQMSLSYVLYSPSSLPPSVLLSSPVTSNPSLFLSSV